MEIGDIIGAREFEGYDLSADIHYASGEGAVHVVHNNSTHYLMFTANFMVLDSVYKLEAVMRYDHLPEEALSDLYVTMLEEAVKIAKER